MDEEDFEEDNKPKVKERKEKRKPVSKRVQLKRRQEFDLRSASKGETSTAINPQWSKYYEGVLGVEAAAELQLALAQESPLSFLFSVFWSLGFPPLSASTQTVIQEIETNPVFSTYSIPLADLTPELKVILERESRLGRCLLKRSATLIAAMSMLHIQPDHHVLDILADQESQEACLRTQAKVVLLRKLPPVFDAPTSVWQSSWSHNSSHSFDRIVCRVPNSEDGRLHNSRKDWTNWKMANARELQPLQLKLTQDLCAKNLTVGGLLVYVTSSLNPIENQDVINLLVQENANLRLVEQRWISANQPGGGGYCAVLEKTGTVSERDAVNLVQANDCVARLKNPTCLGAIVGVSRHRPSSLTDCFDLEPNISLVHEFNVQKEEWSILSDKAGTDSFLCSPAVEDYVMREAESGRVRRCGVLLMHQNRLEQTALVFVKRGLNTLKITGEEEVSSTLRLALKDKRIPLLVPSEKEELDDNFYVVELSFDDRERKISRAQRKRMKQSKNGEVGRVVRRACTLFGRAMFEEEDKKYLEIVNDEDWLESCAHAIFSTL